MRTVARLVFRKYWTKKLQKKVDAVSQQAPAIALLEVTPLRDQSARMEVVLNEVTYPSVLQTTHSAVLLPGPALELLAGCAVLQHGSSEALLFCTDPKPT